MSKAVCVGYICFWIGLACESVGNMPKSPAEPHPWWLPFAIAAMLITPTLLGYMAGKEDSVK